MKKLILAATILAVTTTVGYAQDKNKSTKSDYNDAGASGRNSGSSGSANSENRNSGSNNSGSTSSNSTGSSKGETHSAPVNGHPESRERNKALNDAMKDD